MNVKQVFWCSVTLSPIEDAMTFFSDIVKSSYYSEKYYRFFIRGNSLNKILSVYIWKECPVLTNNVQTDQSHRRTHLNGVCRDTYMTQPTTKLLISYFTPQECVQHSLLFLDLSWVCGIIRWWDICSFNELIHTCRWLNARDPWDPIGC